MLAPAPLLIAARRNRPAGGAPAAVASRAKRPDLSAMAATRTEASKTVADTHPARFPDSAASLFWRPVSMADRQQRRASRLLAHQEVGREEATPRRRIQGQTRT